MALKTVFKGIQGRLSAAMILMAALATVGSVVGIQQLTRVNEQINRLSAERLPVLIDTGRLAETSTRLTAIAPLLASANNQAAIDNTLKSLNAVQAETNSIIGQFSGVPTAKALAASQETLNASLNDLRSAVASGQKARNALAEVRGKLSAAHKSIIDNILPAVEAVNGEIVMESMMVGSSGDEATTALDNFANRHVVILQELLTIQSEVNLLYGTVRTAAQSDATQMVQLTEAMAQIDTRLRKSFDILSDRIDIAAIKEGSDALLALGFGDNGVSQNRLAELAAYAKTQTALESARDATARLQETVVQQVAAAKHDVATDTVRAGDMANFGTMVLAAIAVSGILFALAAILLYLQPHIVRPLKTLTAAMRELSDNRLDTELPSGGKHEIAEMQSALVVFRDNAVAVKKLQDEQAQNSAVMEQQRREALHKVAASFDERVATIVDSVSEAVTALNNTAGTLTNDVNETATASKTVAEAAENASDNVTAVANSAQELARAISEVSGNIAEAAKLTGKANDGAQSSQTELDALSTAITDVNAIVQEIADVAAQTNLLALNATIEAARAGDAGKGFAVVASEVKGLANRTQSMTDDITAKVKAVQGSAENSIKAVSTIIEGIQELNKTTTSAAASIEEQSFTTNEISDNAQQASVGTSGVSERMVNIQDATARAGDATLALRNAAGSLTDQTASLKQQIQSLLQDIRAA